MIGALKEHWGAAKVDGICRRHGASSATF